MLYKDCTSTGESLYFLYFREKKQSMLTQPKEEKQKKYRQSDGFIVPMNAGNAAGGKGATYGNNQEGNLCNTQRLAKQENNFQGEKYWILRGLIKDQPYEEPDAGKPHVRFCEGRALRGVRLLDPGTTLGEWIGVVVAWIWLSKNEIKQ